ncbi:hypothetical protein IZU89_14760 [Cellulophaga lytica]|uniref:hypothetical protein n=1 Tax=Cellulophaga lytica TaxID=979 RepID=UPI0004F6EB67|nr:hypothetical protein [Cellulophaga lytica]AIM61622.1 hypothetical protein IX49_14195 [Cellulophaga lytica]SNQ44659.1 Conserved hypothetical periplasmic protein [Cellulophaga lytica]
MKILKVIPFFVFLITATLSAQDIAEHTAGLRLGDSKGFGAELSYQKSLTRYTRLEANLGWRDSKNFDAFKVSGIHQWVFAIDNGFNWYYGAGAGFGSVDFEPIADPNNPSNVQKPDGGLFIFAAGDVGIEYNFDFPLLVSLDIRPEIGLTGYEHFSDNFDFDIALGLRYKF